MINSSVRSLKPILLAICLLPGIVIAQVIIDSKVVDGAEVFEIKKETATYVYQKAAGGFSSLYDRQGRDWIQYNEEGEESYPQSSASHFRGLPNLVYKGEDGGVGHPGFNKMTSHQTSSNQIKSISNSGKWAWTWTFYDKYAHFSLEEIDTTRAYWFLYEGPIGGRFAPKQHYWGTNLDGPRTEQPDLINNREIYEQWQTVYFGDKEVDEVFFVHQMQSDTLRDLYTYMGNDPVLNNDSQDGMVVFGFGRDMQATPLLRSKHQFIIGFYTGSVTGTREHRRILKYINRIKS